MKNILKWCAGFFIVMALVAGLKMAKFSLLRPPDMDEHMADYRGDPDGSSPAFHPNGPGPEGHSPFGEPAHTGMEWAFVLADLIDLMVYGLILLPLFYAAYLLGKRTLRMPRLNIASIPNMNSFKSDERSSAESNPVSVAQGDYSMSDNHLFDQLL